MIRRIEVLGYGCLRYVRQSLDSFHVLVGPNGSGKTTFLDSVAFVGDLLAHGLEEAVARRAADIRDLIWRRMGERFEIALEFAIPDDRKAEGEDYDLCRYEIAVGADGSPSETAIIAEKVTLMTSSVARPRVTGGKRGLFPEPPAPPATILTPKARRGTRTVVNKVPGGPDNFYNERRRGLWNPAFNFGPRRSALANLPEDESIFPVSTWVKTVLIEGVQRLALNSSLMRKPSPPGQPRRFRPDGSNLPWIVDTLLRKDPARFREWILHLRTALPDLEDVRTVERQEDRHRYLVLCYQGGLEVPSWMVSDGTLRLLALTLPAYVPDFSGIYLIEEPENGIHPRAIETVFQSLSSVYGAQILLATHSPVILSLPELSQVLCFARTPEGATDIVRGTEHPALSGWRGETNLGVLFAGGVLG